MAKRTKTTPTAPAPELTPAEKAARAQESLAWAIESLRRDEAAARKEVAAFAARLATEAATPGSDLTYSLGWATNTYAGAAQAKVLGTILALHEKGATWDDIRESATRQALQGARNPGRSTSPASNLIESEVTAAWARAIEALDGICRLDAKAKVAAWEAARAATEAA